MPKRRYLTTPIYYVNSVPHAGHALTTVVADIEKRAWTMQGEHPHFLTGTDENGLKVLEAAQAAGETPQAFVDRISKTFTDEFDRLNVQYDDFIRTTEPRHVRAVTRLFEILRENGHVYLDTYEGWYDVASETFVKESDLVDGKSPDGNEVTRVSEENWFFRLSAFEAPLLAHIEANPDFLMPPGRRNEVLSFIKGGLRDICISRANPGWGIPVPGDEAKVVYVWFDALVNYLAAAGWPDDPNWESLWPADVHWMAKEIFTRFHATLWPAMLMGAGLPLPKCVIAHGWFVFGDAKMSKSLGNVIAPGEIIEAFVQAGCAPEVAVDVARYVIARALPYEGDTNLSWGEIGRTYNADLANDLGNALNRSVSMAHKFVDGRVPDAELEAEGVTAVAEIKAGAETALLNHRVDELVDSSIKVARWLNKYIDVRVPWSLAKSGDPALGSVLRTMLFALRSAEGLLRPVAPAAADEMAAQLGVDPLTKWSGIGTSGSMPPGVRLAAPKPVFPRLESPLMVEPEAEAAPTPPKAVKPPKPGPVSELEFADFMKVGLKVARVIDATRVEGSEKLLRLQVTIGDEKRQIVAGIAKAYEPLDLIGRQVVVVANLKPAKLMGHESQGMVLAADGVDGMPILLQPEQESPEGSDVH